LLKLVTKVIEPTSGILDVKGHVHALLQIGTGFHPDFTGRENVRAYLAQLGITGVEADRKCQEAIEFAELEEYIDQPVKTYSTGMGVRLMFAASTAISPELLVLDEVLGVGDAYFAQKSFERMKELCERSGTTLLLVTHDIYSAVRLCERVIWVDRGRVLKDADGPTVVAMYEDSIRQQEEHRLRVKASRRAKELAAQAGVSAETTEVNVEIRARDNVPQASPVYFSRIELAVDGTPVGRIPLDGSVANAEAMIQNEGTSWGESVMWEGRRTRALRNYGSPFHKIAGVVTANQAAAAAGGARLTIEADYWSAQPCALTVHCFVQGRETFLGELPPAAGTWMSARLSNGESGAAPDAQPSGRHGSGAILVRHVRPLARGVEAYTCRHGEPFELEIAYRINEPLLRERPQVLVAFHRDGVQDVMRSISRDLLFDERQSPDGVVSLRYARLPLAPGTYTVTVMVAREHYYDTQQPVYFSVNPNVYSCLTRMIEIVVEGGGGAAMGTAVVTDADWTLIPSSAWVRSGSGRRMDFPAVVEREFPGEFGVAWAAVERVLDAIRGADFSMLARHSPGLASFDWTSYLRCSVARMVRALHALKATGLGGARLLDCGSYFGNVALMCAAAGYAVDAIDSYREYSPALDACVGLMRASGVGVMDFADCGHQLEKVAPGRYDAVMCLGVIEHIPHTPRPFLEAVNRVLAPGGVLILDTPNMAYLYNRVKLAKGESVMAALPTQYVVEPPFEGHHREYTTAELRWMLEALGHHDVTVDTFNYSIYSLENVSDEALAYLGRMDADPELRELMISSSRKR